MRAPAATSGLARVRVLALPPRNNRLDGGSMKLRVRLALGLIGLEVIRGQRGIDVLGRDGCAHLAHGHRVCNGVRTSLVRLEGQ